MISLSNLKKITDFYNSGGSLIFTTRLPSTSAETGKDKEVAALVHSIFAVQEKATELIRTNGKGGKACFIPFPDGQKLTEGLQKMVAGFDVDYPSNPDLQYIHKLIDGRNIYFFANVKGRNIETVVTLRGKVRLEAWDPHTGEFQKMKAEYAKDKASGSNNTTVNLKLKPYHSVFWVEE
jgi:hypothetical protein